jgi:CTP:molybdopterin cytidylyltransferase MocA
VARSLWDAILDMRAPESPREFLKQHSGAIRYVEVETPTILQDLDTPEDYKEFTVSD